MGRLLRLLTESPEILLAILPYLPSLIVMVFTIHIAFFVKNRERSHESNLLVVGAMLKLLAMIAGLVVNYYVIPNMDAFDMSYNHLPYYFGVIGLVEGVGSLIFLYALFFFVKKYLRGKDNSGPTEENINSFIKKY